MKDDIEPDETALEIKDEGGRILTRKGNVWFFKGRPVTSEFYALVNVPFSFHVTIRFKNYLKNPNNAGERVDFLDDLIFPLNRSLKEKYPHLQSGNRTVNYVAVDEFGASHNNVHFHVLIHIHPDALELVKADVLEHLASLNNSALLEVEKPVVVQHVTKRDGMVSYCTKKESGRRGDFKRYYFSVGFIKKIRKFYLKNTEILVENSVNSQLAFSNNSDAACCVSSLLVTL